MIIIDHCSELSDLLMDAMDNGCKDITLIADYEDVAEVLIDFIRRTDDDDFGVGSLELSDPCFDGYDGPFFLSVTMGEIWVEKAYDENTERMLRYDADYIIVNKKYAEEAKKACFDNYTKFIIYRLREDTQIPEKTEDLGNSFKLIKVDGKIYGFEYSNGDREFKYRSNVPIDVESINKLLDGFINNK